MIELIIFNSLYILGLKLSLYDGMIFEYVRKKGERLGKLWMPMGGCVTCMASIHSWPYFLQNDLDFFYIVYTFALASLNTIIYNKYLNDN